MQYAAMSSDGSYAFITNIGAARINGAELALGAGWGTAGRPRSRPR
jgi:hypothetical protein